MIYLVTYGGTRPNRITSTKDAEYHGKYARHCVFNANNNLHQEFLKKIQVNKNFYIGNQWVDTEDLEEFLKDDTGELRNRLKIVNNIIRPMVEQYRGNAIRMEYNATIKSFSKNAINRRESSFAETMMHFNMAKDVPSLKPMLQRRFGVGDTPEETASIFENTYVDAYIEVMNNLLYYVSQLNDFDAIKFETAIPLALNGIAIVKNFEYAGHQRFKVVDAEHFFWDRSGKKYDLSDCGYWGESVPMEITDVFEQFTGLSDDERIAIEKWSTNGMSLTSSHVGSSSNISSTKVPTFLTYWKDTEKIEYGYVLDEYGYPYLTKINFTWPGEEKPRYTDKDLIQVDSVRQKKVLGGKIKKSIYVDLIRYCHFIPNEIVGQDSKIKNDITLDYGVLDYQETNNIDFHNAKPPYCIYTWGYVDGQVVAPVDDAIDPQRMINRILSVAENQINNSRGAGTILDESVFDGDPKKLSEAQRAMNQSRTVMVNAKGRGIQNVTGNYDGTVRQGTQILFNVIDNLSNYTTRMTGVNEAMQGQQGSPEQLVGTTQLMIQHGSLMQEPFYNAISEIMKRCYQAIASVGKNIYVDNERELAIAVGDSGMSLIKLTKDFKAEDFRCFVKRDNVDAVLISAANNMILQLRQLDLIDDVRAADLFNRSTPEQVSVAMRQYGKEKIEMRRQQLKNQNAQLEELTKKQAAQAQLAGAREEQNQIVNQQNQQQAEEAALKKTMLETQSKERVAELGNNRANNEQ